MPERILTRHPDGKRGVNISTEKYQAPGCEKYFVSFPKNLEEWSMSYSLGSLLRNFIMNRLDGWGEVIKEKNNIKSISAIKKITKSA